MIQREEWREIPGYNYAIDITTKEGRCKNLKTGRILSNRPNKGNGRIIWCLNYKKWQAARWIALTYPELVENEYFEGAEIDHKDTDPLNNHPTNLRWVTHKGNMNNNMTVRKESSSHIGKVLTDEQKDKIRQGNIGKHNNPSLYKPVEQYSLNGEYITWFINAVEASKKTGVNEDNIRRNCKGNRKTAGNGKERFIWKYKG